MQLYQNLLIHKDDTITTITINRPTKLNALNNQTILELSQAIQESIEDPTVRGIILTGSGEKAFVAGADISELAQADSVQAKELARKVQENLFNRIEQSPKPIVAAVNGYALGGGCELAMACHFRIAANTAKFGQPEINLGTIPGYGGTQRLVQLIGKSRALQMLLTGKPIDADEAFRWGLANDVVPLGTLQESTYSFLRELSTKAPFAVAQIIHCVNDYYNKKQDGFESEIEAFGKCADTEDFKEGTRAFLEKRPAVFIGK